MNVKESGFYDAVKQTTQEMLDTQKAKELLREAKELILQQKEIIDTQEQIIQNLEKRCSNYEEIVTLYCAKEKDYEKQIDIYKAYSDKLNDLLERMVTHRD